MSETIGTAYIQIEPSAEGITGSISKVLDPEASAAGASAGGKLSTALGASAKLGITAIAGATAAVGMFGKSAVDAGMQFDSSMSQVAATMGDNANKMIQYNGETMKASDALRQFAQEMGASTAFSATQAAQALNYMALAGYDATTSIDMLPTVLDLAAAGGMDLARASDMVTDAQSALGLSISDTSTMVSQMATTASRSNTSVEQLGDAILQIGANAQQLTGGTTELATTLGLLADNGIKGAEGGTHLRNILLSLNPTTDKAVNAWNALGVSAYDAQGNLRPLEDTFMDLSAAMADMSSQERTQMLSAMFNKTDLASVNALLGTQKQRWDELSTSIASSSDAAGEMANTQMDNLTGDITFMKSALEGVQIQVADMLTPSLREFTQLASTGLSDIAKALQGGSIEDAFGAIGTFLGDLLTKITGMLPEIISAATSLVSSFGQAIIDNLPMLIETGLQIILQLASSIAEALPTLIPTIVDIVLQITDTLIENVDLLVDGAIALIIGLAEGIINALPKLIEKAPEIVIKLADAIIRNAPKILTAAVELIVQLAKGWVENYPKFLATVPALIIKLVQKFIEYKSKMMETGKDLIAGLWEGIQNAWSGLVDKAKNLAKSLVDTFTSTLKIGSPSKVFEDEVGRWIPEGVAVGIEGNLDPLDKSMSMMQSKISPDNLSATQTITADYDVERSGSNNEDVTSILNKYLPLLLNRDIVLDTGKTIGSLAPGMNKELGRIAARGTV